jgi:hypothetical protein
MKRRLELQFNVQGTLFFIGNAGTQPQSLRLHGWMCEFKFLFFPHFRLLSWYWLRVLVVSAKAEINFVGNCWKDHHDQM